MRRTQIYIDESTYKTLKKESEISGKTISEIIRESLREKINKKIDNILRRTKDVYGIWKDRELEVKRFVRDLRRDRKL